MAITKLPACCDLLIGYQDRLKVYKHIYDLLLVKINFESTFRV